MADPNALRAAAAKLGARLAHEDSARKHNAAQTRDAESTAIRDKYRRIAEHRRYPKKEHYSWEDLVIGSMAMDAGINRYYAMKAGRQAKKALDYLSQAAQAAKPETKTKALRLARRHLTEVSREHHPELVEQLEGRILWEEGWRPETWDSDRNAPRERGPSINPQTGQQEFFAPFEWIKNKFGTSSSNEAVPTNATTAATSPESLHDKYMRTGQTPNLGGTVYFGGAGMDGAYIQDMGEALKEAGFSQVRTADPEKWSLGHGSIVDSALAVPFLRTHQTTPRVFDMNTFTEKTTPDEPFNLLGFSHGSLAAAQAATNYADMGGNVDNLVLMGSPISQEFLDQLKSNPRIRNVMIKDLTQHGDPVHAGMSAAELPSAAAGLLKDKVLAPFRDDDAVGHYYYSGEDAEGQKRRRAIANEFYGIMNPKK